MKIASVFIQDLEGYSNFHLELTYPEGHEKAGKALDRVCLIGMNGSGRSRLMNLLIQYINEVFRFKSKHLFLVKLQIDEKFIYSVHLRNEVLFFNEEIDEEPAWKIELIQNGAFTLEFNKKYEKYCIGFEEDPELFDSLWFENNCNSVLVSQPSEPYKNRLIGLKDLPSTKSRDVHSLSGNYPFLNVISPEKITEFWALIIYTILKRDKAFKKHLQKPESQALPSSVMKLNFDREFPDVLKGLLALWNPVLEKAGMEVDLENMNEPVSNSDALELYIKMKGSKGKRVLYKDLGAGFRKYLFGLGHIWILHCHRKLDNGFAFIEEPENHLHPKLIEGLVATYHQAIQGKQLFMSSHSPLIAAQFEPCERIIWTEEGPRTSDLAPGASIDELLQADFA